MSLKKCQRGILISLEYSPSPEYTQEEMSSILKQKDVGKKTCGPCSIIHSLSLDASEIDGLVERLRKVKSKKMLWLPMYTDIHGMFTEDVPACLWEMYDIDARAISLHRNKTEEGYAFVKRVHSILQEALKKGHMPIIEMVTYVASREKEGQEYKWYVTCGHFNVLESVQEELRENDNGFTGRFIESLTGKVETYYLYFEQFRDYCAISYTYGMETPCDEPKREWATDYPFMLVVTPNIQLDTKHLAFHSRTITVLQYAIS